METQFVAVPGSKNLNYLVYAPSEDSNGPIFVGYVFFSDGLWYFQVGQDTHTLFGAVALAAIAAFVVEKNFNSRPEVKQ